MAQISDIMVSPALVYRAPIGTALPDASVAFGGTWPDPWEKYAYTNAPLTANYEIAKMDLTVEQLRGPAGAIPESEGFTFETSLAEFTPENLHTVFGGTLAEVEANGGVPAHTTFKFGGIERFSYYTWAFEGAFPSDLRTVRFQILIGNAEVGGQLEFGKATQLGIPLSVTAYFDRDKPAGEQIATGYFVTSQVV